MILQQIQGGFFLVLFFQQFGFPTNKTFVPIYSYISIPFHTHDIIWCFNSRSTQRRQSKKNCPAARCFSLLPEVAIGVHNSTGAKRAIKTMSKANLLPGRWEVMEVGCKVSEGKRYKQRGSYVIIFFVFSFFSPHVFLLYRVFCFYRTCFLFCLVGFSMLVYIRLSTFGCL